VRVPHPDSARSFKHACLLIDSLQGVDSGTPYDRPATCSRDINTLRDHGPSHQRSCGIVNQDVGAILRDRGQARRNGGRTRLAARNDGSNAGVGAQPRHEFAIQMFPRNHDDDFSDIRRFG